MACTVWRKRGTVYRFYPRAFRFDGAAHAVPLPGGEAWTVPLSSRGHRHGDRIAGTRAPGADEELFLRGIRPFRALRRFCRSAMR